MSAWTESRATAGQLITVQRITVPVWAWAGGAEHDDNTKCLYR